MRHAWMVIILALAGVQFLSGSATAQDKPIELKFSSWVGTIHGHHTGVMVPWAKMIEEKSGGRLKVTIYPGGTLGKPADHFDLVQNGIADMGFSLRLGYTPGRFPLISVTELPLLFKTSKGGSQAAWSLFDKYFKTEFTGVKVLWIWVIPPGHVHLAKKPQGKLEDLASSNPCGHAHARQCGVKALGGIPVNIAAPETYNALEQGSDGTIFPWEAISSFNLAEVLRYHAVVDLFVAPLFTLMNQKRYDSLPPTSARSSTTSAVPGAPDCFCAGGGRHRWHLPAHRRLECGPAHPGDNALQHGG